MRAILLLTLLVCLSAGTAAAMDVDTTGVVSADTTLVFRLEAGHKLYPDWKEEHEVHLNQEFWLGDLPFRGVIRWFLPDFKIIDGRITNASPALENPSIFVVVLGDTAAVDSSWAFLNFPPHTSQTQFFTFQLEEIRGYVPPETPEPAKEGGN